MSTPPNAPLRRAAAVLALFALGSCGTSYEWREVDVGVVPFEDVWDATVDIARTDGYPLDAAGTDRGRRVFESRWRTQAVPFRRGYRHRIHAEFEQRPADLAWLVRFYVERQVIADLAGAFDPTEDDWSSAGQDQETEKRIAAKLRARFQAPATR